MTRGRNILRLTRPPEARHLNKRLERRLFTAVTLLLGCMPAVAADLDAGAATDGEHSGFQQHVKPFLNQYCIGCHGADKQKADRRFDRITADIADGNALVDLQDILDQLNLASMPPEEAKQPTHQQRRQVVAWLTSRAKRHHRLRRGQGNETVLRRLNAREYRATVRDLLRLNMTMFDPTVEFPRDQLSGHLDNVGGTLVMSGHLLARHLAAAERVVDKAMALRTKPPVQTWTFRDGFRQQPEIDQVHRKTNNFSHMTLYDVTGADKMEGAYGPIHAFSQGVPYDGLYEIRIKAEALNREHPYDPAFLGLDPKEPLRLGIVAGNREAGPLHKPQPMEPLLAEIDLADESKWYTVRVWLDAGFTPRFTFRNGLMDARSLWSRLVRKYPDHFPKLKSRGIVEVRFNAIKYGKLPQIHIDEIEIKGPIYDQWPLDSHRAVLGDDWLSIVEDESQLTQPKIESHLARFMAQAYRRPLDEQELAPVLRVIRKRIDQGRSPLDAYSDGLKMVLCSPNFLYLNEGGLPADDKPADDKPADDKPADDKPNSGTDPSEDDRALNASALASRISYFLWGSMPDQELTRLARSGKLLEPAILRSQVRRMLADSRSDALVDGFLDSWLTLRELGATPPDRGKFRAYYHYDLKHAMRRETHLFTRHLLDANKSIFEFLDADYVFANKRLAQLYGIPWEGEQDGQDQVERVSQSDIRSDVMLCDQEFRRVEVSDRRRGGLLGQASVLTVTANGIDTSPVVRGVWLLENLLGTPPSPPPPDVEPLDPDVRGAKTIREQLSKHRDVASCMDCHRKIDPLGFALENFDPIGGWRENYDRKAPIDASGKMPNGREFKDIRGFKAILSDQKTLFARSLATKLLQYAMGRPTTVADRPAIDQIVAQTDDGQLGFRDVIERVVLSEPFRSQ